MPVTAPSVTPSMTSERSPSSYTPLPPSSSVTSNQNIASSTVPRAAVTTPSPVLPSIPVISLTTSTPTGNFASSTTTPLATTAPFTPDISPTTSTPSPPPSSSVASVQNTCQSPWIEFQGSCYNLSTQAFPWKDARDYCVADGAQLVRIESSAENDFIKNEYMADGLDFWIGLTDEQAEDVWKWSDGSALSGWTNWCDGQPSDTVLQHRQNCGGIRTRLNRGEDAQWHDKECSSAKGFICKK
ncbi:lectin BRA-3-like [Oculina patagonica]